MNQFAEHGRTRLDLVRAGAFLAACIACNAISGQNPRVQARSHNQ